MFPSFISFILNTLYSVDVAKHFRAQSLFVCVAIWDLVLKVQHVCSFWSSWCSVLQLNCKNVASCWVILISVVLKFGVNKPKIQWLLPLSNFILPLSINILNSEVSFLPHLSWSVPPLLSFTPSLPLSLSLWRWFFRSLPLTPACWALITHSLSVLGCPPLVWVSNVAR